MKRSCERKIDRYNPYVAGLDERLRIMLDNRESQSMYPCVFPVKVIGECSDEFEADVFSVMKGYVENLCEEKIGRKVSEGGKYLSLTIYIIARNREQLDTLYAGLKARKKVIMVL